MIAGPLFEWKVHADGEWRSWFEAEEGVEAMRFAVCDQTYVGSRERGFAEVIDESADDAFAEATFLVLWVDGDIYDLEEEAAVAYDAAHANGFAVFADDDGVEGVG
jgi:hypothetical protein